MMLRTIRLQGLLPGLLLFFGGANLWAQTASLAGKVTGDKGEALSGVTVRLKGTNKSAATNESGTYLIQGLAAGTYTVVFSSEQLEASEEIISLSDGQSLVLDKQLVAKSVGADPIVIIGYGRQNRRDLTGSIARVSGKEIAELPAPSFEAALQGKAPGVQVVVGSGMAGSASLIRIRGVASISAAGDPLYVIDGIPVSQDYFLNRSNGSNYGSGFNNNPLATINPDDIESVEILKDAAATSIYGSRGANGVILITTKRARKKGLKFDVSTRFGISQPTKTPRMLNGPEFLQMYQEAWENDGRTGTPDLGLINVNMTWQEAQKYNTNWVDDVIQTGYKQNYNITAGYTNKWFGMKSIVTYDNNESFLAGNNYQRLSGRVNTDYKPLKGLNISLSNSLSRGINRRVDAAWAGGLGSAMSTMLPIFPKEPLLNSNGIGYRTPVGLGTIRDLKDWRSIELRSINNLNLTYEVTDDITLNGSASYDYMDYGEFLYEPQELIRYYSPNYVQNGVAKWFPIWTSNMNYYLTANWNKKITPDHGVNVMLGHEYQQSRTTSKSVENLDATGPTDKVAIPDTALRAFGRTPYEWAFLSYFGRANYKFKNKFNVQVTGRVDGSSRFGRNNRYGFFPAAAVGYILSDEEFIKRHDWISFLKVKVGIGKSGNASFDNYARWGTITPSGNLPQYNGQPMLAPARLENQNLRWESTRNFDATLEGSLFKNRISFEITYYDKATKDVILDVTVPRTTGFYSMYDNVGGIINRGVEFVLKSKNIQRKNFQWNTDFNIARNYNEITSIGVYSEDAVSGGTNDTRVVVGYPVGTNFLVRFSHIDQATGLPVYLDKEGKETMKWDPANRVPVGDVLPEAIGSLNNSFTYKNWDLAANIYYSIGGDIYESSAKRQLGVQTDWNSDPRVFDRWQKPGDEAKYPRRTLNTFTYGSTTPWINTTQWLEDGSYVRLRSLSIGYRLPSSVAKKYHLDGARIAFIATNLLTWTNYTGLDPEIARDFESPTDRNMSGSITYLTAPQEKSYSISLSVNF